MILPIVTGFIAVAISYLAMGYMLRKKVTRLELHADGMLRAHKAELSSQWGGVAGRLSEQLDQAKNEAQEYRDRAVKEFGFYHKFSWE
jgi:hypothetical protein